MSIRKAALIAPIILLTYCASGSCDKNSMTFTVSVNVVGNGTINLASATVNLNDKISFIITPKMGNKIETVSGCGGSFSGNTYTTGPVTTDCIVSASFTPALATPILTFIPTKNLRITWTGIVGATHYKLFEKRDGASGFKQVGVDIPSGLEVFDHVVPFYQRLNAEYLLQSCFIGGCNNSAQVSVSDTLADNIGYFKSSKTDVSDNFSWPVSITEDSNILGVVSHEEGSDNLGEEGDQTTDSEPNSGAAYVFVRNSVNWYQQAYLKASNTGADNLFSGSVSISADGNTLAVGAYWENSNASGLNGNQIDNSANKSGSVYVFVRSGISWTRQAHLKTSKSDAGDLFGGSVSLSADGNTLAVGVPREDSNATDVNGNQSDNSAPDSGAVYVFTRSGITWTQQAYLKASVTVEADAFGNRVSISADGNTLAVGASGEQGNAGAVYVFVRSGINWSQQAYLKASNTGEGDLFGWSVSIGTDGNTLAVGAPRESSDATSVYGNQRNNSAPDSGAVYVFARRGFTWTQHAYIKARNTDAGDLFGLSVSLSANGNTLMVGSYKQDGFHIGGWQPE